ncbi:MAG: DNA polymerase III subunit gamma/tau [Polaromonas sp.]|nr:DNA polymerase III subunit gamma/tau [Polaromonas sp.]
MSYLVLARKYRPRNFSEMVGQSHVVQALSNALGTQRLHHAYLFTGTRGVGKTTISRILAKSLNCLGADGQGGITATPCGACQACTDIDSGRFVDYTELDAASNRGVDEIAQLLEQAVYKPVVGRFKVFMIDEVHMLTNTAFNAMLKTLEEPPEYLKFVLATTDPQKVPATVLSRCLQFNLRPMAPETIREHLTQVLQAENVASEPQALRLLARAARGSMRDALSLADQAIAFGSGQLQEASVRQMLGSVDRSYVFQLLDALARGDGKSVVETSEVLRLNGLSAASTLEEMATVLQRMAVLQAVPGIGAGDDESDPDVAATARLAQALPADETQLLYSLCLHGRAELGLAPDDYAALTMVLLRLLAFKPADAAMAVAAGGAVEPPKKSLPDRAPVAAGAAPAIPQPIEPNRPPAPVTLAQSAPDFIASSPLPPQVETTAPAPDSSLGDVWTALVNRMVAAETVAALARELALQSELRAQAEGVWTLRVERESLNQAAAREKLQLALQAALQDSGQAVQLAVELGPVSDSPARRNAAAQMERQRQAEETIQNDPFVQDMMRDWGAKIVPGSIKPLASKPI